MDFGVDLNITNIPDINIGIDPMKFEIAPIEIKPLHITLAPLQITLAPIEIKPIDFSLRIKEIPSVRVWLPADYKVCVALFGSELASIRLCGQAQIITEPYIANPCECRPDRRNILVVRDDVQPAQPSG